MRLEDLFFAGLLVLLVLIAAGFVKLCQKYRVAGIAAGLALVYLIVVLFNAELLD